MVTPARESEFAWVRERVQSWATDQALITAVALVGSWARDEQRMDSDIDVVVLTTETDRFNDHVDWIDELFGEGANLVRTASWGVLTERRVRLASGLDIEFGIVDPLWAATDPVDTGTRRVVSDGCVPWFDPQGLVAELIVAVGS